MDHVAIPQMTHFERRLDSFTASWPCAQRPWDLASAGLFYLGEGDKTQCFRCGGGLENWETHDIPAVEHARYYPQCGYGREEVDEDDLELKIVYDVLCRGYNQSIVQDVLTEKHKFGARFQSVDELIDAYTEKEEPVPEKPSPPDVRNAETVEELTKHFEQMKLERICKVCLDFDSEISFQPCCHMVTCLPCSKKVEKCPVCRTEIRRKDRIFLS